MYPSLLAFNTTVFKTQQPKLPLLQQPPRKKVWYANGLVSPEKHFYVDVAEWNRTNLIPRIRQGLVFVLLAPRLSGKSTRVHQLMQIYSSEFIFFYIDFLFLFASMEEDKRLRQDDYSYVARNFFTLLMESISRTAQSSYGVDIPEKTTFVDFIQFKGKQLFKDRKCVFIFDEFDVLRRLTNKSEQEGFLATLRAGKQNANSPFGSSCLHSAIAVTNCIAACLFDSYGNSPFNTADPAYCPDFTEEEHKALFEQYSSQENIVIEEKILKQIYLDSAGSAGLGQMYGWLYHYLRGVARHELSYSEWMQVASTQDVFQHFGNSGGFKHMSQVITPDTDTGLRNCMELSTKFSALYAISPDVKENLVRANVLRRNTAGGLEYVNPFVRRYVCHLLVKDRVIPLESLPVDDHGALDVPALVCSAIRVMNPLQIISAPKKITHRGPKQSVYRDEFNSVMKILLSQTLSFSFLPEVSVIPTQSNNLLSHSNPHSHSQKYSYTQSHSFPSPVQLPHSHGQSHLQTSSKVYGQQKECYPKQTSNSPTIGTSPSTNATPSRPTSGSPTMRTNNGSSSSSANTPTGSSPKLKAAANNKADSSSSRAPGSSTTSRRSKRAARVRIASLFGCGYHGTVGFEHAANVIPNASDRPDESLIRKVYGQPPFYQTSGSQVWVIHWIPTEDRENETKFWFPREDYVNTLYVCHDKLFTKFVVHSKDKRYKVENPILYNCTHNRNKRGVGKPREIKDAAAASTNLVKIAGIANQGNTCYASSVAQCLSATIPLVKQLIEAVSPSGKPSPLTCQLLLLFRQLWQVPGVVQPLDFIKAVRQQFPARFSEEQPHDAYEFLVKLEDHLLDQIKPLAGLVHGELRCVSKCLNCKKAYKQSEQVNTLELPIFGKSLAESWTHFTSVEKLHDFNCADCGAKSKGTKVQRFKEFPKLFTVCLKRFDYDRSLQRDKKVTTAIDIPEQWTLHDQEYELYAYINHSGDEPIVGDYTATVRIDDKWYTCSGSDVSLVADKKTTLRQAYILFYYNRSCFTSADWAFPTHVSQFFAPAKHLLPDFVPSAAERTTSTAALTVSGPLSTSDSSTPLKLVPLEVTYNGKTRKIRVPANKILRDALKGFNGVSFDGLDFVLKYRFAEKDEDEEEEFEATLDAQMDLYVGVKNGFLLDFDNKLSSPFEW